MIRAIANYYLKRSLAVAAIFLFGFMNGMAFEDYTQILAKAREKVRMERCQPRLPEVSIAGAEYSGNSRYYEGGKR